MSSKTDHLKFTREKTGERLVELMNEKHMSNTYLLQKAKLIMTPQQFSQIKKKRRTLQREDAIKLSEVFGIDPGYLLGIDGFKATSYNEYIQIINDKSDFQKGLECVHHYDYIINLINGYRLVGATPDDESADYTYLGDSVTGKNSDNISVIRSGIVATIPASEMERFEHDVLDYIKVRFDALMMRYRDEEEEQRAKNDRYSYIHASTRK